MDIDGAARRVHARRDEAHLRRQHAVRIGVGDDPGALPVLDRCQALLVEGQEDFAAAGAGNGQQCAARLNQVARLDVARLHDAIDLGVNTGSCQVRTGDLQTLPQDLFLAATFGQRCGGEAGAITHYACGQLRAARLLQRLGSQQLALEQRFAALQLAAGLFQIVLCLAQGGLRLRSSGIDELLQRRFGLAQARALFVVAQFQQQIAGVHRVAFPHMACGNHAGDFAADLRQRLAVHFTTGHHALHQWASFQAVGRQFRALQLTPDQPAANRQ